MNHYTISKQCIEQFFYQLFKDYPIGTEQKDLPGDIRYLHNSFEDDNGSNIWEKFQGYGSEHSLYNSYFTISDSGIIFHVPDDQTLSQHIGNIETLSLIVSEAYENDHTKDGQTLWEYLKLGGDDDVDYNSSYIDVITGTITELLELDTKPYIQFKEGYSTITIYYILNKITI